MRKVILDTDIGSDADDAGALAMLAGMHNRGECELLGVASCTSKTFAPECVRAILDDYALNLPIAALQDGFDDTHNYYCTLFAGRDAAHTEEYVAFYRRLLAKHRDVVLIAIGPLHGLAQVLHSGADAASPLTGEELFRQSVTEVYAMCGRFDGDVEWNISLDPDAARSFLNRCPAPVTICPFEAGCGVMTGARLRPETAAHEIYRSFTAQGLRDSWDPLTVYAAVNGKGCEYLRCTLSIDATGRTVCGEGARHRVLTAHPDAAALDEFMV